MTPFEFPGCNVNAAPPPGFEEMIAPLIGFHNGRTWVTAWHPTPEDLAKLNAGEPVYVSVMSGSRRDVGGSIHPQHHSDVRRDGRRLPGRRPRHRSRLVSNIHEIPLRKGNKEFADYLREYADKVESGEIENFVIAARYQGENKLERCGDWKDVWEILGALEYAKSAIISTLM